MKKILFLGTSLVGAQYIQKAIESLGFYPVFLLNIDEYSGLPRRAIEACEYYSADVNSLPDILNTIEKNNLIENCVGITSLLDETLHHACRVAEIHNIKGPDSALIRLTDKTWVHAIIAEYGPPSLIFKADELSQKQLDQFILEHGSEEYLLKPGISSGAVGIHVFNNSLDANAITQYIAAAKLNSSAKENWILQPRINGNLYSLEGFVSNAQVSFLGFSKRVRKAFTECINEFPADQYLSEKLQQRCQQAIETLVERSNLQNGFFHCEFIITDQNAFFIDANMGRIAGAAIAQQIALAYNKKPEELYRHVFDLSIFQGKFSENVRYQQSNNSETTLSIQYGLKNNGCVFNIDELNGLSCFHTPVADNGKQIPALGTSDSAWVGLLAGLRSQVLAEIELIEIKTNQGIVKPYFADNENSSNTFKD